MYNDQDRVFRYAVLFSVVLHGVLLFGISGVRDSATRVAPPGPIVARLVEPPVAPPAATPQAEPAKPQADEKPPPPPPAVKPVPAPKPRPVAKAEPKRPAPPPVPPSAPAVEAAAEAPPSSTAPSAAAAPAAPPAAVAKVDPAPGATPPSAEPSDAGSLAQYRLQLISAARKYKRYPRVAMDNNWEGDVVVRMVIGANGMITALSVKSSSGHDVLDQQALEMFKRAKPMVQIPPALRGKEFTIELRAIYSLKDQQPS